VDNDLSTRAPTELELNFIIQLLIQAAWDENMEIRSREPWEHDYSAVSYMKYMITTISKNLQTLTLLLF
jgi:hypothetical protein